MGTGMPQRQHSGERIQWPWASWMQDDLRLAIGAIGRGPIGGSLDIHSSGHNCLDEH